MNAHKGAQIHPGPLFHFRIFSPVSRSTKDLSYMKVPAHRDRKTHPTTILLCKSQSSQAALVPKEHKMFMEEAYNAGDHQPWDSGRVEMGWSVSADPIRSLHSKSPGDEDQKESTPLGSWGCQGPCGHSETFSREPYTPFLASSCLLRHHLKAKKKNPSFPHTSPSPFSPHLCMP